MEPTLIALITAGVTFLVSYVAPKAVRRTKTKVDDKIVEYVRQHLPDLVKLIEGQLGKPQVGRERTRDHRTPGK